MILLWPAFLVALLPIPVLIGLYIWARKRRRGVRYPHVPLLRVALPRPSRRQHVPFGLFTVALAVLAIGAARPAVELPVPTGTSTLMLAIDTSGSMCGDRLEAAKQGAATFVLRHAETRLVGIVGFNSSAGIAALPTNDEKTLLGALEFLVGKGGTRIDLGIQVAIDAIADINPQVQHTTVKLPAPPDPPQYVADVIVVLSDGAADRDVTAASEMAAARGIRIYPIAYTMPAGLECSLMATPDVPSLQAIADLTGGELRMANSAAELDAVFDGLPTYLWVSVEPVEVSVALAAVGMALAAAAVLLGRWWRPLP